MKTVGIIAEYNPFHNGHWYHIQQTKKITGADFVVVVMSGNFVQRGAPAIIDKYSRTLSALSFGADLVLELPVRYATGSAEYFATGAMALLHNLSFVDSICFGSECGDIQLLTLIARTLASEPDSFQNWIPDLLKKGYTYPAARRESILSYFHEPKNGQFDQCISSPNNILGIEYIKAGLIFNTPIQFFTIPRKDADYHADKLSVNSPDLTDQHMAISSASAIRHCFSTHCSMEPAKNSLPDGVYHNLKEKENKTFPIFENDCSPFLSYQLLLEHGHYDSFVDVSTDLGNRIQNLFPKYMDFKQFSQLLKTRQYTQTRINRCLIHILLDLKKQTRKKKNSTLITPYIRILGLKKSASHLLRSTSHPPLVPIITKTAKAKQILGKEAMDLLQEDFFASQLYNQIVLNKFNTSLPNDYFCSPIIVP